MAKLTQIKDGAGRVLSWYGEPELPPPHINIGAILVTVKDRNGEALFGLERDGAKQLIDSLEKTFKL